jgi:hypothetical protein
MRLEAGEQRRLFPVQNNVAWHLKAKDHQIEVC